MSTFLPEESKAQFRDSGGEAKSMRRNNPNATLRFV